MDGLGVKYEAVSPGVDESVPPGTPVRDAVVLLARRKAEAVAECHPDALVLGADQLVSVDGRALGKPIDRGQAREQLRLILGRTHEILTGVCLLGGGAPRRVIDEVRMTAFALSDGELERYLDLEEWRGCAGSYRVEARGQALFENIEGDRTSVQGLPMLVVNRLLRDVGHRPLEE